jgi:hypothetical protein
MGRPLVLLAAGAFFLWSCAYFLHHFVRVSEAYGRLLIFR